jgi:hypothetical protein
MSRAKKERKKLALMMMASKKKKKKTPESKSTKPIILSNNEETSLMKQKKSVKKRSLSKSIKKTQSYQGLTSELTPIPEQAPHIVPKPDDSNMDSSRKDISLSMPKLVKKKLKKDKKHKKSALEYHVEDAKAWQTDREEYSSCISKFHNILHMALDMQLFGGSSENCDTSKDKHGLKIWAKLLSRTAQLSHGANKFIEQLASRLYEQQMLITKAHSVLVPAKLKEKRPRNMLELPTFAILRKTVLSHPNTGRKILNWILGLLTGSVVNTTRSLREVLCLLYTHNSSFKNRTICHSVQLLTIWGLVRGMIGSWLASLTAMNGHCSSLSKF